MSRKSLILSAALLATTPGFAPAADLLHGKRETAAGTVALADLDLSTASGTAEARRRLTVMAKHLCRKFRDDRKVEDLESYIDCVHDTLASALDRIQSPTRNVARN
jgi:UrcA family protein